MLEKILRHTVKEKMCVDYDFIVDNEDKVYSIDLDEFLGEKVNEYPSYLYGVVGDLLLYGWQVLDFIEDLNYVDEVIHGVYCYI